MKKLKVHSSPYFNSSDLIPESWNEPFWDGFSESAPFSWGDAEVTLITLDSFKEQVFSVLEHDDSFSESSCSEFYGVIQHLSGDSLVNLEM